MAKLIRAVLIDSINRGSNIEIMLDSNTALTGTNGIGKTSFLKLLAIFYGARPGQVVKADGSNNLNFGQWYLPHESSYLIFEYENYEGQRCCAVLHHSSSSYSYRLIEGAWHQDLVYQDADAGVLVKPGNLIHHCLRMQRSCSPEMTQTSYRLILQYNTGNDDMKEVTDKAQRNQIEILRKRFSLAPRGKEVAGIDTITLTLIDGGNNFEGLRKIITDILKQDNDDPAGALSAIQLHELKGLVDGLEAYRMYESDVRPKIDRLDTLLTEHRSKSEQLSKAKCRIELSTEQALDEKELVNEKLEAKRKDRDAFEESWEAQRGKLEHAVSEAQVAFGTADKKLKDLERQEAVYADMQIEDMVKRCERQADRTAERDAKQSELNGLERAGSNVRLDYQQRITDVKDRCAARLTAESSREKPLRERAQSEIAKVRKQYDDDKASLEESKANALAPYEEQLKRLADEQGSISGELKITRQLKVLPSDQQEIDLTRDQIDAKSEKLKVLASQEREQSKIGGRHQDDQRQLASEKSALEKQQASVQTTLESLQAQLNASQATLLGFLRRNHPTWQDNIGRLLPPAILMRDDLNPEIAGSADQASLFGVTLNTALLPTQTLANTDELRASIAEAESERQHLDELNAGLTAKAKQLQVAKREFDEKAHQLRRLMTREEEDQNILRSLLESLLDRASENRQLHIESLEEQLNQLSESHDQALGKIEEIKAEYGRHLIHLTTTMKGAEGDLEAELKAELEQIEELKTGIVEQQQREIDELERNMESALSDAGVDVSITRKLNNDLKELTKELSWIEENISRVEAFKRWKLNEWSQRGELERQYNEANRNNDSARRQKQNFDDRAKTDRANFKAHIDKLEQQRNRIADDLHTLERLNESLENIHSDPDALLTPGQTAQDLDNDIKLIKKAQSKIHDNGSRLYGEVINQFRSRHKNSQHAMHIEGVAKSAREAAEHYDNAWLHGADQLVTDMPQFHETQRDKLIGMASNTGDSISDGRIQLEDINESIQRLSREATARAKVVAESFVSLDIESVKIVSKIRDLEFWSDLQYFEQQYRRWRALGDDQLPSEGYIHALEKIIVWLKLERLTTNLADCFTLEVALSDSGRQKLITNDSSFKTSSSEGLKVVLQCMLFVSLFELLRKDADLQIIFPLDETLRLSAENYIPLLQALNERQIVSVAGFPEGSPEILAHFKHSYEFYRERPSAPLEIRQYVNPEPDELDALHAAWAEQEITA